MSFKKNTVERESWINILNDIFNPTFGFVQIWVEKNTAFLECIYVMSDKNSLNIVLPVAH